MQKINPDQLDMDGMIYPVHIKLIRVIRLQGEGSTVDGNTGNTTENIGVTATAPAVAGGNTGNTSNTGKTANTTQVDDWGLI